MFDGVRPGVPEVGIGKGIRSHITKSLEGYAKEVEFELVSFKGVLSKRVVCRFESERVLSGCDVQGRIVEGPSLEVRRPGRWLLQWARRGQAREDFESGQGQKGRLDL